MKTALLFLLPMLVGAQTLDFETYRAKVEPIFLKKKPGHARCIVCHEGTRTALQLQGLAEGQKTFTPEQSKKNYDAIVLRVVNKTNPAKSALLMHPLAGAGGGDDFHSGGQQFATKDDPDWKVLAAWVGVK